MPDGGGAMTPDELVELRDLRRRAYAPGGDIDRDPAALARLSELEAAARPSAPPVDEPPVTASAAAPEPSRAADPFADLRADGPDDAVADDATAETGKTGLRVRARPRSRRRPRLVLVWAATLVAALVLGAAATWGSVRLVSRAGGTDQVAVLQADPAFDMPPVLGDNVTEDVVGYEDFYGVTAITGGGRWMGAASDADSCLMLMRTEDTTRESVNWSTLGWGCGVGEFSATAQFRVDLGSPDALRERFADGTPVQFVFDGERIGVYVGQAPEPEQAAGSDT
ncbi:hypothetical protein ACIQLJ_15920 [Microbacterium sp. NPDC091313]